MFQLEVTSAAILCRIAQCTKKRKKAIYYQELTLLKVRAKNDKKFEYPLFHLANKEIQSIDYRTGNFGKCSHPTYLVYILKDLRRQKVQQPLRKIAPFLDLGELCVV